MQVLLNLEETYAVMMRMTGAILDHVELSEEGRKALLEWRKNRQQGTKELDDFVVEFNEGLGTHVDERMSRRLRLRGGLYVAETEARR